MVLDLMITWWQFTIVGALILVGVVVNLCGVDNDKELIGFKAKEMPHDATHHHPHSRERILGCDTHVVTRYSHLDNHQGLSLHHPR